MRMSDSIEIKPFEMKIEGEDVSEKFRLKEPITLDLLVPERPRAIVLDMFPERLN